MGGCTELGIQSNNLGHFYGMIGIRACMARMAKIARLLSFQSFHFSVSWRDTVGISSTREEGQRTEEDEGRKRMRFVTNMWRWLFWGSYALLMGIFLDMRTDIYIDRLSC